MIKKLAILILLCGASALFAEEARGYLGISVGMVNDSEHPGESDHGVFVVSVHKGSGAAEAGLKPHDKIVSINGVQIQTHDALTNALKSYRPKDEVTVTVMRGDEELSYSVVLGDSPKRLHFSPKGNRKFGYVLDQERPWLGIEMQTLKPQLAKFFKVEAGVLVEEVVADGPAERAGLAAGDVIIGWNGESIVNGKTLQHNLFSAKKDDVADLLIVRDGKEMNLQVTIGAREGFSWNHQGLDFNFSQLSDLAELGVAIPDFKNFKFEWDGEEFQEEMENLKKHMQELKHRMHKEHEEKKEKMH